eukprot:359154-Chlamydomonas_euryale.AAC.8
MGTISSKPMSGASGVTKMGGGDVTNRGWVRREGTGKVWEQRCGWVMDNGHQQQRAHAHRCLQMCVKEKQADIKTLARSEQATALARYNGIALLAHGQSVKTSGKPNHLSVTSGQLHCRASHRAVSQRRYKKTARSRISQH